MSVSLFNLIPQPETFLISGEGNGNFQITLQAGNQVVDGTFSVRDLKKLLPKCNAENIHTIAIDSFRSKEFISFDLKRIIEASTQLKSLNLTFVKDRLLLGLTSTAQELDFAALANVDPVLLANQIKANGFYSSISFEKCTFETRAKVELWNAMQIALSKVKMIGELNFHGCNLTTFDSSVCFLPHKGPEIVRLDLSNNKIRNVYFLVEIIRNCQIESLNLSGNPGISDVMIFLGAVHKIARPPCIVMDEDKMTMEEKVLLQMINNRSDLKISEK